MAQTFHLAKLIIQAPPEGDLLPRYRYEARLVGNDDGELQTVTFLSDDENPFSAEDTCTTIDGLITDGEIEIVAPFINAAAAGAIPAFALS